MRVAQSTVVCIGSEMEEPGLMMIEAWSGSISKSGALTARGKSWTHVT